MGLFKKPWEKDFSKIEDETKREKAINKAAAAVERLDDQKVLQEIVCNQNQPSIVRGAALLRLATSNAIPGTAYLADIDDNTLSTAFGRLGEQDAKSSFLQKVDSFFKRRKLLAQLGASDAELVLKLAHSDPDPMVRWDAVCKLRSWNTVDTLSSADMAAIYKGVLERGTKEEKLAMLKGIEQDDPVAETARNDPDPNVRTAALRLVRDWEVIADIFKNDPSSWVQKEALERLKGCPFPEKYLSLEDKKNAYRKILRGGICSDEIAEFLAEEDPDLLADYACRTQNANEILSILKRLTSMAAIERIDKGPLKCYYRDKSKVYQAVKKRKEEVFLWTLGNMTQEELLDVALNGQRYNYYNPLKASLAAVELISAESVLLEVIQKADEPRVREAAFEKIQSPEALLKLQKEWPDSTLFAEIWARLVKFPPNVWRERVDEGLVYALVDILQGSGTNYFAFGGYSHFTTAGCAVIEVLRGFYRAGCLDAGTVQKLNGMCVSHGGRHTDQGGSGCHTDEIEKSLYFTFED